MIFSLLFSCTSPPDFLENTSFSPALHQIVLSLRWRYGEHCQGIEAYWSTTLPKDTIVQVMAGPKTENPHFDEDALQNKKVSIDSSGLAHLPMQAIQYDDRKNFLNIRVWGNEVPILHMLKKSERNGGFPIAEGPDGPYGWAESLIPACNPEAQ